MRSNARKVTALAALAIVGLTSAARATPLAEDTFEGYGLFSNINNQGAGSGWSDNWGAYSSFFGPQFTYLNNVRNGAPLSYPGYTSSTTPAATPAQYLNLAAGFGGPGFNAIERTLDMSPTGPFAAAGLTGTNAYGQTAINADNTSVYGSFLVANTNSGTQFWLRNPKPNEAVDSKFSVASAAPNGTSLILYRIDFKPGNDTISIWNAPNLATWTPSAPKYATAQGDFSFNKFIFVVDRNDSESQIDDIRFGLTASDVAPFPSAAPDRTWTAGGSGDYQTGGNWSDGNVPNAINAVANFSAAATGGSAAITSASPITLGTLRLTSSSPHTLTAPGLSLASNTSNVQVVVSGAAHQIVAPVAASQSTDFSVGAGSSLALSSLTTAYSSVTLTKSGPGLLSSASTTLTGTFVNSSGPSSLGTLSGTGSVVVNGGTVSADKLVAARATVNSGGVLALTPSNTVSTISSLTLGGGSFDVGNNTVIFKNGDFESIRAAAANAGILSSLADANTTVAVFKNVADDGVTPYFDSYGSATNLTTSDVIVRYTYKGDTNLDGVLDGTDYKHVLEGYVNGLTGWQWGDIDNSGGPISLADATAFFTLYDNAPASSLPSLGYPAGGASIGVAAIPEPAALALFAPLTLAFRRRRCMN
jgi:hypothetical protein